MGECASPQLYGISTDCRAVGLMREVRVWSHIVLARDLIVCRVAWCVDQARVACYNAPQHVAFGVVVYVVVARATVRALGLVMVCAIV